MKQVDAQVRRILREVDVYSLTSKERGIVDDLQQQLIDSKIYAQGYELSETREEQLENANTAKYWLDKARKNIVLASEFNIFGAIDVAHLTAQIDQVTTNLE